jgi:hypothetical protein
MPKPPSSIDLQQIHLQLGSIGEKSLEYLAARRLRFPSDVIALPNRYADNQLTFRLERWFTYCSSSRPNAVKHVSS